MDVCVLGLRGIPNVAGGVETHCAQLYPRLSEIRHQDNYRIIGRSPHVGTSSYRFGPRIEVLPLPAFRHGYFEAISNTFFGVLAARLRMRTDLLHIHAIGPGLMVPLARLLGLKVILTHHGDDFRRAKWNGVAKGALRLGERFGVQFADTVIAVSPSLSERLKREYPRKASVIHYIPNGADHFAANPAGANEVLTRFGLQAGDYIVSVGRLVPEKGFEDLIAAHRASGLKYPLVIVGGPDSSDYHLHLKRSAHAGVVFTDNVDPAQVAALVGSSRLFVLASHHEGLPIAALEALAVGAPILMSDIQPNRDLDLPEQHYFSVGNVDHLRDRLQVSLATPPVAELNPRFTWGKIARDVAALYELLDPHSVPIARETAQRQPDA